MSWDTLFRISLLAGNSESNSPGSERHRDLPLPDNSSEAKIVPLLFNTDNTGFVLQKTIFDKRSDWEKRRRHPEDQHAPKIVFRRTSIRDSVSISTLSECLSNKSGNCRKGCHKTQQVSCRSVAASDSLFDFPACASIRLMLGVVICE